MARPWAILASLSRYLCTTAAILLALGRLQDAAAQTCGNDYVLKDGETLALIAERVYGNAGQWSVIFYANQDRLGSNAALIAPGVQLRLPCMGRLTAQPELHLRTNPQPQSISPVLLMQSSRRSSFIISTMVKRMQFVTADGLSPYTGRALAGGGMLTEIVSSAMELIKEEARGRFDYNISWVNDWSAHLNPLLRSRAFDVGFPWSRPDCDSDAKLEPGSAERCEHFFFSDPLYEVVTNLFVRSESPIRGLRTEDITGKTLCRAAGFSAHELNQGGRNWLKDGRITLVRAPTVDECFRMLDAGSVDGVVEAELAGRTAMASLDIAGRVRVVEQPVALTTLHVLVAKAHPHARTILYYMNTSLSKLRESGEYERIIEQHLARFWASQASGRDAAPAPPPKPSPFSILPASAAAKTQP